MGGQSCRPSFGSHPYWQCSHMCKSFKKNIADSMSGLHWVQWHHRDHPLRDFLISFTTSELRQWNPRPPWRQEEISQESSLKAQERAREMDNQADHSSRHLLCQVLELLAHGFCLGQGFSRQCSSSQLAHMRLGKGRRWEVLSSPMCFFTQWQ